MSMPTITAFRFVRATLLLCCAASLITACAFDTEEGGLEQGLADNPTNPALVQEPNLRELIDQHRTRVGLQPVALSEELTQVALAHVRDLEEYYPAEPCSLHSWSKSSRWRGCCYTQHQPDVECMVDKPRELTSYLGHGYEIAVERLSSPLTAEDAMQAWLESRPHRAVLESSGEWAGERWQAMGVAMSTHYAVVWFGAEPPQRKAAAMPPVLDY
jgi:hypothetical protein